MADEIKPAILIEEFDSARQESLLSTETALDGRNISDADWLYLEIYSGDDIIDTKWESVANNKNIDINDGGVNIDFYDLLVEDYDYDAGNYRIIYCFKRKAVLPNDWVRIAEVSKNKMEIRVDAVAEDALTEVRNPLINGEYYAPLDLYTGDHKNPDYKTDNFIKAVSWLWDEHYEDETLILKLGDKAPRELKVGNQIELWDEIISKNELNIIVAIDLPKGLETYTELRGPKITLDVNSEVGKPTEFESWNQVFAGSATTTNQVINKMFSGSSAGAELNIDYRKFENFIHFSSANERLTNFKYKVSLVEYYESKSVAHSSGLAGQISSSVTASQTYMSLSADYTIQKNNVLGSFDDFENYLYYDSASIETVDGIEYYNTTWPKTTINKPHTNYPVTSSEAQSWLTGSFESASRYDESNLSILRKTIPSAIEYDQNNSGFVLFVDMISQHFDILYNYIDNLNNQRVRDENLNEGISKDLIFDTIKSFGWKPESGLDLTKIWEYWLGTDEDGNYQTTSSAEYPTGGTHNTPQPSLNYVVTESMSKRDLELEPVSSLINNLPYILKTKGTNRGLKALLNCYGIPSSFFKIQEFGGPDPSRHNANYLASPRELDIQNHALHFKGGLYSAAPSCSFLSGSWDNADAIQSVEFRLKTNYQNSQSLFGGKYFAGNNYPTSQLFLIPSKSAGDPHTNYAYLKYCFWDNGGSTFMSGSLGKLPILDNDWWNIALVNDDEGKKIKVICQKAPDHANGLITHKDSIEIAYASTDQSKAWGNAYVTEWSFGREGKISTAMFQNSGSNVDHFSGSLQELRFWSIELDDKVIDQHTQAATSIVGNSFSSSFTDLIYRIPLGTNNNLPATSSANGLQSTHPDQSKTGISAISTILSGSFEWDDEDEVYYVSTPNSFGLRSVSNKIRIEDNSVNGVLDPFTSQESSSSDTNPIDLPDLYVSISPQDDLDIDIAMQMGSLNLDDFIGDPRQKNSNSYPDLKLVRDEYFKKYSGSQNLQQFIRSIKFLNSSLFKQIDRMLPARGTNVVGLMIKPTLLERPKIDTEPSFSYQRADHLMTDRDAENLDHYTQSIDVYPSRMLSQSDDYDAMYYTFEDGSGASQWFSTLTDTIKTEAGNEPNKYKHKICTKNLNGSLRTTDYSGNDLHYVQLGVMPFVSSSRSKPLYNKLMYHYSSSTSQSLNLWYSSSHQPVEINQQDVFVGFYNSFVGGCKMTSDDFNIPSPHTIDGGPVVEFLEGNPNILISEKPSFKGDIDVY